HSARQRGLRDIATFGSPREIHGFAQGQIIPYLMKFHATLMSFGVSASGARRRHETHDVEWKRPCSSRYSARSPTGGTPDAGPPCSGARRPGDQAEIFLSAARSLFGGSMKTTGILLSPSSALPLTRTFSAGCSPYQSVHFRPMSCVSFR